MKKTSNLPRFAKALSLAAVTAILPTTVFAQSNQTIDSGTQTWDAGITQNWDGGTDTWTAQNNAYFNSNTVTVSGTVTATQVNFNSGVSTISGGVIDLSGFGGGYTSINQYNNSGPNTISSELDLGPSGGDSQVFVNPNSQNLTLGDMVWTPSGANDRVQLNAYDGGGSITLNGKYTSGGAGTINFGADTGSGTFNIGSTADFSSFGGNFSLTGTALNIANSTFNYQTVAFYTVTQANQINIQGSQNINLNFYSSQKNDGSLGTDPDGVSTVGQMRVTQSTAAESTWNGSSNQNGGNTTVGAVAGGRLNWNVNLGSSTPLGLTVNSATNNTGVVVISQANSYDLRDGNGIQQPGSTVAATIAHGTALITNTTGSAFGNNSGVVNVESGATLGGSGISTEQVVVVAGGIIAPGDAGQAGLSIAPSIATLHLTGGLSLASGATLAFKLNGALNDMIDLGAGALTLAGTTNLDFTALGPVQTYDPITGNHYYTLATGTGTWSSTASFNVTAPAGYVTDHVIYSATGHELEIEFAAVPEPSTYALMIGGLAFLGFCVRRKSQKI
jgi:hypothetical protein